MPVEGGRLYSLYQKVNTEWIGNHRLPLGQAIRSAKFIREYYKAPVAVVPDNADPAPYLNRVETLA